VQALFALNERYFVNEKGSVGAADSFAIRPEGFGEVAAGLSDAQDETPKPS
jgi:hypothetical protein